MKTITRLVLSLVLLTGLAFAQDAPRELKVRSLCFDEEFPPEIHAHLPSGSATAGLVQVKPFLNHEVNRLQIKGNTLVFTVKSDPVSATDMNLRLGEVEIAPDATSVILLFVPDAAELTNHHSRVFVIDDSAAGFPAGSFKIANFSSVPLKIELEKDTYEVPPNESKVIAKLPVGEGEMAGMRAFFKQGDEWKIISSGSWADPGTRRVLQLVTEDPVTKQVSIKGIRDVFVP